MLSVMTSNSLWILFLRLLFLSSAILSMEEILKFYVPLVVDILVSDVPAVWSSIVLWLRPPYLYLLFNFIIVSILASSKLHQYLVDPPPTTVPKLYDDSRADFRVIRAVGDVLEKNGRDADEDFAADVSEDEGKSDAELYSKISDGENDENEETDRSRLQNEDSVENLLQKYDKKPLKLYADSRADFTVIRAVGDVLEKSDRDADEDFAADVSEDEEKSDAELYSKISDRENDGNGETGRSRLQKEDYLVEKLLQKYDKKPPISLKIGNRKAAKAATTPAGTTSKWSTMNGHDTLDDAWNAITEGNSAPFSRRLDKSNTCESHTTRNEEEEETAIGQNNSPPKVTKSETSFKNNDKNLELKRSAAAVRVRKMPSVTEEELNRRVEAFIEKFKEEMRLQREKSLKKFELMINGSYY
ncbi:uncharacterized protein LOC111475963 [Cucurbita maxima]|uniref:Uncharacterized protein LOC111475963 n=1 Tax=Cucurbita maxima TaxID=3661 RepID=A0A6J1IHJ9_CUCMA|nr:uncharacterized protein LOC111475963 [Cucurbita maxima]